MSSNPTLLICDPDVYTLMQLKDSLTEFGFNTLTATNKKEIFDFIGKYKIQVIIINLDLGDTDAIVTCQEIRNKKELAQPFIIIFSNKTEEYIQITSFNSGADDFVQMPIKPILLVARIKAMIRRQTQQLIEEVIPQKGVLIDKERYKIIRDNEELSLPRKEFEILNLLFSNPNKVFSREEIANSIWKNVAVAKQRTIDIHIRNIRKVIGNDMIKTIKGVGYSIN